MTQVRELKDAARFFSNTMIPGAKEAQSESTRIQTEILRGIVAANGARHRLRGRSGGKFPLEARSNTRNFRTRDKSTTVSRGLVSGVPYGFWVIVEYGTDPHLIVGAHKKLAGAGPRQKSSYKRSKARFLKGDEPLNETNPINIPGLGYKQYALHPGARPSGKPWATSMAQARPLLATAGKRVIATTLAKAWVS